MTDDDPGQLARLAARREIQALRIEAIDEIDVVRIANYHRLFIEDGGVIGAEGRSVTEGSAGIIRVRPDITQLARRRFVIAHEIGHCLLHQTGSVRPCSEGDLFRYEDGNREAEANWFAAELLMPARLFRRYCDTTPEPSFTAIADAARACHTTLTATAIRFVQLTAEPCALVWSEAGKVKWVVKSPDCPGWIDRDRPLNGYSHAADVFAGKPVPAGFQPVPQRAWFAGNVGGGRDVMEETRSFTRLGAALSLVWLPTERDSDDDERDTDAVDVRWRH